MVVSDQEHSRDVWQCRDTKSWLLHWDLLPATRNLRWIFEVMWWHYSDPNFLQLDLKAVNNFQLFCRKGDLESDNFVVNHYCSTWKPVKSLFLVVWAQILIKKETQTPDISITDIVMLRKIHSHAPACFFSAMFYCEVHKKYMWDVGITIFNY